MSLRVAAQQALESLERSAKFRDCDYDAMEALKAALAEPELPRQEWQGLTKEEHEELIQWAINLDGTTFSSSLVRATEYKLKEKNT